MRADVALLPTTEVPGTVVVFDVLRMTTTASALLAAGLERLTVVAEVETARDVAAASGALLLGERHGVALPGFDGGNSPLHAPSLAERGREAVVCTTNGSRAVEAAASAERLLLGAIVNADAVAAALLSQPTDEVLLMCAGTEGRVSLDDALGAACVLRALQRRGRELSLSDAAAMSLLLLDASDDVARTLAGASHARFLCGIGFERDVSYAARLDLLDVVPTRRQVSPARFEPWREGVTRS